MGYTHYYRGLTATPVVVADDRKIIDASGVTICGPRGEGLPILSETHGIRLNGFAAAGEAYATFTVLGLAGFARATPAWFCTTDRKPYDVVVTAILTAAAIRKPWNTAQRRPMEQMGTRHHALRNGSPAPHPGPKDRTRHRHRGHAPRKLTPGFGPSRAS
ncbi:hypothetical protein NicSoilC5_03110 [Arthrobacter sp. NicSoilC5]|nr:hypothetical protein NicSoilC5_03110 [Arthrobacter sp. NicSoilC5]